MHTSYMPSQKPRDHHYVPQGYLRGFTETTNLLYVYNKETKGVRQTSTKGIAYSRDYYTVDTLDEKDSSEVEDNLGRIETVVIPILSEIIAEEDLSNPKRADLAIYIAVQYGRTPVAKARMDEVATILATNETKTMMAEAVNDEAKYQEMVQRIQSDDPDRYVPSRETLIEWILKPGPMAKVSMDRGTYVKQFFENAEHIAEGLLRTKWTVITAPRDSSFITSDNPIGLTVDRKLQEHEALAIMLPGVTRYFPLDSKHCLVITDDLTGRDIERRTASKSEVRIINKVIFEQAYKYAISGNEYLLNSLIK